MQQTISYLILFFCIITIHAEEYTKFASYVGAGVYHPGAMLHEPYDDPEFLASGIGSNLEFHVRITDRTKTVFSFAYYTFDRSRIFGAGANGNGIQPSLDFDYLLFEPNNALTISVGGQVSYLQEKIHFHYPDEVLFSTSGSSSPPSSGTDFYNMIGFGPVLEITVFRFINLRGAIPLLIPINCSRTVENTTPETKNDLKVTPACGAPRISLAFGWKW